jgi:hypothetical protein
MSSDMTQRKAYSSNDYENRRKPVWVMMLTSTFVSFVSCLDACLEAVGVRPPLDRAATVIVIHTSNLGIS